MESSAAKNLNLSCSLVLAFSKSWIFLSSHFGHHETVFDGMCQHKQEALVGFLGWKSNARHQTGFARKRSGDFLAQRLAVCTWSWHFLINACSFFLCRLFCKADANKMKIVACLQYFGRSTIADRLAAMTDAHTKDWHSSVEAAHALALFDRHTIYGANPIHRVGKRAASMGSKARSACNHKVSFLYMFFIFQMLNIS